MSKRRSSLTGSWSGAYRYPGDAFPETVFNAQIEEVGGAFSGSIQEPNITQSGFGRLLAADIEGTRAGSAVNFVKFYSGNGMDHAVRYEGTVDSNFTRIDGAWSIPGVWSGTFFMTRDDLGETANAEVAEEIEIPR